MASQVLRIHDRLREPGVVEPGAGHVESISAVTLVTRDMAEATAFYDAVGFPLVYGGPDAPFTTYRAGSGYVNLQLDPGWAPGPTVWGRVIFWVDDVDAVHRRVVDAGLEPTTEPADAPWGERYFHVSDPDGHELSFARPLGS
jgi:catechol 2,3-dioxygenase-like lactoylglutathione lyase family enzyme